ncbi:MAG TPA: MlaD family protein [Halothiobacillus sp.]|nr:MlaD family protein [Halothiobacillus sp.]
MESKINYTAVGLFVVLLGLGVAVTAYWLVTGGKQQQFIPYVIYATDSVTGLSVNSHVLYRGVDVGEVKSIRIDQKNPGRIRILVDLDANVPIRTDTVAQLRPQGVTGLSILNLTGGKVATPLTARNEDGDLVIPYEPSIFSQLEGGLSESMVKVSRMTDRLDQLLSEKNVEKLTKTLDNIDALTTALAERRGDIAEAIVAGRKTLQNTAEVTHSTAGLLRQGRHVLNKFSRAIDALQQTLNTTNAAVVKVAKASESTEKLTQAGTATLLDIKQQTLPELGSLLERLQDASVSISQLVRQLNANPSQILYGAAPVPPGPGEAGARAAPATAQPVGTPRSGP